MSIARLRKRNADGFENIVLGCAQRSGFVCLRIPNGCRTVGKKIVRTKSPFDFVASMKTGSGMFPEKTIFFDAKTTELQKFPAAKITDHQLVHLLQLERAGYNAGYLVRFESLNESIFFPAKVLDDHRISRAAIHPFSGIKLGSANDFRLTEIAYFGKPGLTPEKDVCSDKTCQIPSTPKKISQQSDSCD